MVFFDTTSIYFEVQGGDSLGERGFSKDHRPDLKQMVEGAKSLVGDKGYRKCLKVDRDSARIDIDKVKYESRFDSKCKGHCGKIFKAVKVAIPSTIREVN